MNKKGLKNMTIIITKDNTHAVYAGNTSVDTVNIGNEAVWKESVQGAMMINGPTFNSVINKAATQFVKSATAPPNTVIASDISELQIKSIVTWYDEASTTQYWYSNRNIVYLNQDCSKMFNECVSLTELDLSAFDTSKVFNMSLMFYGCLVLTQINLSNFNTTNVSNMGGMFFNCKKLVSLDLSHFNTSNVIKMDNMFNACNTLTTLNISNFDTSKVNGMYGMFWGCEKLTVLDLSSFNTSKVIIMGNMFATCTLLTAIDVSSFNTSSATRMNSMFRNCRALVSLDLSKFNTSKVIDMNAMFDNCPALTSLIGIDDFNISSITYPTSTTNTNGTYEMFKRTTLEKPNWSGGTWDANGTFIKTA